MGKKHKKHKAEKAEWRSASATAYGGENRGRRGAGGSVFAPGGGFTVPPPRYCRWVPASLRGQARSRAPAGSGPCLRAEAAGGGQGPGDRRRVGPGRGGVRRGAGGAEQVVPRGRQEATASAGRRLGRGLRNAERALGRCWVVL